MFKPKSLIAAIALVGGLAFGASTAQAAGEGGVEPELQNWTFGGIFGTYDEHQLQRGFQVFREVCANCHSARLLAFRNLSEEGGPHFSEEQIKLLASEYTVLDVEAEGGERTAVPADRWPSPFLTEQDARDANNGALPPDFSVIAKARSIAKPFPFWLFDYFTAYQEAGPDYIYNLLTHYADAPHDVEVGEGQYYNAFLGHGLSMAPPLADGLVTYEGEGTPMTLEQYSKDVSAFLMWVAEPHLASRKEMGFRVMIVLVLFSVMMYLTKRKLWSKIPH